MADILSSTREVSIQLLTEDGAYSKLIKVPNPLDNLGGYANVVSTLAPLIAEYQYTDGATTTQMKGIFCDYKAGARVTFTQFGEIQVIIKQTTKLVP